MQLIFNIVYELLKFASVLTGLSYNEINIVAYYMILPFVYVVLLDKIIWRHVLKVIYVLAWAVLLFSTKSFSAFSDWLFDQSVHFLLSFRAIGWDYISASVLVCVVAPSLVFVVLFYLAYPAFCQRRFSAIFKSPNRAKN